MDNLSNSLLGKTTPYKDTYDPSLLFPIARAGKRNEIGITDILPFNGVDIWNAYEISWLNLNGKPQVAIGEFYIPASSECIIESKSFKLYLNSFNNTKFFSIKEVEEVIKRDLETILQTTIIVRLLTLDTAQKIVSFGGTNIDDIDIICDEYSAPNPGLLRLEEQIIEEELSSNLLKSNCLVTGQPDWASVSIKYLGQKINRESLLQYLVSFRNHNEFHEQCVERIFADIMKIAAPSKLTVYARYTRRGGLDICPYRTTEKDFAIPANERLIRQ